MGQPLEQQQPGAAGADDPDLEGREQGLAAVAEQPGLPVISRIGLGRRWKRGLVEDAQAPAHATRAVARSVRLPSGSHRSPATACSAKTSPPTTWPRVRSRRAG